MFQTLIGTVKRRGAARLSEISARGVSNPHRYGQKETRKAKAGISPEVSNPHRYGQKKRGGSIYLIHFDGFKPS